MKREIKAIRSQLNARRRAGYRADDEGRWITTENGHHVHINDKGVPDKGNPHVIAAMTGGKAGRGIVSGSSKKRANTVKQEVYTGPRSGNKKLDNQFDKARQALAEWKKAQEDENKAYRKVCRKLGIKGTRSSSINSGENQRKVREAKDPDLISAQKATRNAMGKHVRATQKLKDLYNDYRKNGGESITEYYAASREWDDFD